MLERKTNIRLLNWQKSGGRAANRNCPEQSFQIQYSILDEASVLRRIFQKGLCLILALEVYAVAGHALPAVYSANGILFNRVASGYRANDSGALANMGGNGNYWSYAPNSQANARNLNFNSGNVNPLNNNNRSNGFSVRPCRAFDKQTDICSQAMHYNFKQVHLMVTTAYLKAREEEREKYSQLEFELDLENNINTLSEQIYSREWKPGHLNWFILTAPSIREVFAPQFRDRIVSHVIFMMLSPVFERHFIYDSFSCRTGKGTLRAIDRFEHHIRSVTDNYRHEAYILNMDITGYFMSINRGRLYEIIWETLNKHRQTEPELMDYELAEYLTSTILFRDPLDGCLYHGNPELKKLVRPEKSQFGKPEGVGIPIGDVINQLNSNIYLNPFDWYAKKTLRLRNYIRYVDDAKCLHVDRQVLERCREEAAEFLDKSLGLRLHPNKTTITGILEETNYFLGAAVRPFRRYADNEPIERLRRYVSSLESSLVSGREINLRDELSCINARLGYLQHFDELKNIEKTFSRAPHVREVFIFTRNYKQAIINQKHYEVQIH